MTSEQLEIKYPDRNDFNKFWLYLSNKLQPLLQQYPLQDWIEMIGNRLYSQCPSPTNHIALQNYFKIVKVKDCTHNKDLAVQARLINNGTSFTIEIKDYGEKNDTRLQRYFIAHEIAHTFFFNTHEYPFADYSFFPVGSKEIEFLCNRLSRSILLPKILLQAKLGRIKTPMDEGFDLDYINKLCDFFRVPYNILLSRLIQDTGSWNCLFLRFRNYETEVNNWKLKERYLPAVYWYNIKAFIPLEDDKKSKDDPKRYPSAKGKLKYTLDSVYNELKDKKRLTHKYNLAEISDSPLRAFLNTYFPSGKDIIIHFSLGKGRYSSTQYINLCIPLPHNMK